MLGRRTTRVHRQCLLAAFMERTRQLMMTTRTIITPVATTTARLMTTTMVTAVVTTVTAMARVIITVTAMAVATLTVMEPTTSTATDTSLTTGLWSVPLRFMVLQRRTHPNLRTRITSTECQQCD